MPVSNTKTLMSRRDYKLVKWTTPIEHDGIRVLATTLNTESIDETEQEQESSENYEESSDQEFSLYLPEMYALAGKVDEIVTDVPASREFIEALSVDRHCREAVAFLGKSNSIITYDSNGVLPHVSSIDGAS